MFGNLRTIRDRRHGSRTGRYLAIGASAALGAVALLALATPASAHASAITATPACETATGDYILTWSVGNDWAGEMTLTSVAATPTAITAIVTGAVVPAKAGTANGRITGPHRVAGTATTAPLKITAPWSDPVSPTASKTITLAGTCAPAPPKCVSAAAATYTHAFNGVTATATITTHGLPLCAGQKQSFTLASYTTPAPGYALPQQRFDTATGVIDTTHPTVTLHIDVPPCNTAIYLIWGTATNDHITTGNPYADTTLGGTTAPGNRSTGPLGKYSGSTGACAIPTATPTATCAANCEATAGGTPQPTTPATTAPTPTTPAGTTPTEPATATFSNSLPVTGQSTTPLAAAGIALALIGAVLLLVSRKRPQRTN